MSRLLPYARDGRLRAVLAVLATVTALLGATFLGGRAFASTEPALTTPTATLDAALRCPSAFTHPNHEPVLLVHGFASSYEDSWAWGMAPALRGAGFDVCGIDLPEHALGDIQLSTEYVVHAIDAIHAATGRSVGVVAHSEGNLEAHWALKWWPHLQSEVADVVDLAAPEHGIVGGNLVCVLPCTPAAAQFSGGSHFLAALNSGDETPGPVAYTSVYSLTDPAIVPATTAITNGATNIAIQDVCPGRVVTHLGFLYDSVVYQLVLDALSHSGPANPSRLPFGACLGLYAPGVTAAEAAYAEGVRAPADAATALVDGDYTVDGEPALMPYARS
ncbi:esterase/lipase family protein [Streptacidiphilus jiangxiensis]|uniref:Lipase (Class 2) n=1 Tax=Streptacidiphilus jiangxiensis TaxID=235985 RepID=A0A1H7T3X4_STRJI|nr:hypothetical protein [Streptacidiphilus jiangxiensis]SEL79600.1 Lipase (class 2) [Streptacidiphilus jiangxiensis]